MDALAIDGKAVEMRCPSMTRSPADSADTEGGPRFAFGAPFRRQASTGSPCLRRRKAGAPWDVPS